MTIVRFNNWDEFLTELKGSDRQDRTVRLTLSLRFDRQQVPYLTMVVGFTDHSGIVEFVHYLGVEPRDRTCAKARDIAALIEERKGILEGLGYKVRSGRYHVPPTSSR